MAKLCSLLIGYAFGIIQAAYLIGRMNGIDIREYGSGNAGTTNAVRVLGKKAGAVVLLIDALKCLLALLLVTALFSKQYPDKIYLLKVYALAGCILGHDYPFYMKFRGGKGVAVMLGFVIAFAPGLFPFAVACFLLPFFLTHYVSLSSLIVYAAIPLWMIVQGARGKFAPATGAINAEMYILMILLSVMAYTRHKENIKRLLNGTENKTYLTKRRE
ncbi:MAG: glycerol-3-phosphate 1-O-acyltransferase PlsY [Lachnospiraceae bacterium]|nr:glycerol-3-phosphate 1-O-acyltransferase PlsY [Lachnospiraceae bacterium]